MAKGADLNAYQVNQEVAVVDTNKRVKIGIIGTGWIAEVHAKALKQCPDVDIVALADLVPGKAEKFAKTWGIEGARYYESDVALLESEKDLDCVTICTYNTQHAPCAIHALEAGVHVLLEKPFTVTLEEAVEVMKAEKKSGKILSIGFQPRFSSNIQLIKKIVQSGELGDIYYVQTGAGRRRGIPTPFGTSFIEKETGGIGALGDIGCYSLDMLLNAIGYPKPLTATGYKADFFGKNPDYYENHPEYAQKFGVEDFAAGFVRLEGGIILDFRIAWAMHMDSCGDALILGTKGGLKIPAVNGFQGGGAESYTIYKTLGTQTVEYKVPLEPTDETIFYKKVRAFIDAVKNGTKTPISSSEIIYNQAIIDGISKSAELGKEVEIVIPEI